MNCPDKLWQWQWQWHTQRSPASIEWRPGLTGKSVGTMVPQKRICFTGRTCSLARCANTNCLWTECNATSLEMNSSKKGEKVKQKPQAIAVLNSRIIYWILRFGATPLTEHEEHREPRSQGKPGDQEKGTREEDGKIPRYSSRTCCWSQIFPSHQKYSYLDASFCWEPVTYFLIVFCQRSPCSWPLHSYCFRPHIALDRFQTHFRIRAILPSIVQVLLGNCFVTDFLNKLFDVISNVHPMEYETYCNATNQWSRLNSIPG